MRIIPLLALAATLPVANLIAAPILSRTHTDVGIGFEDGALDPHVHAEEYDLEYAPGAVVLRVLPQAHEIIPANPAFSFLGAAGASTWILPQDEATATAKGVLLLGLGAEEIDPVLFNGNLSVNLVNVVFTPEVDGTATGNFAMFTTGSGGVPTLQMSTHDGIDAGDLATVIPGTHFDPNWAFSQPGRYAISLQFSGTLAGGSPVSADATYTFVVKSFASAQGTQLARNEVITVGSDFAFVTKAAPISVGPDGGGIATLTIKGFGSSATSVNSTNDTVLAHVHNYRTTILAREGDIVPGLAGAALRTFNDGFITASGECAFSAMLLQGTGVTKADDAILLARVYDPGSDTHVLSTIAREGSPVPNLAGFHWTKFLSYLPAEDGSVTVIGIARNPATSVNKTVAIRAQNTGTTFDFALLAATGNPILTDSGIHTVKSITRATRPGTRSADQGGAVELLIGLSDGTTEIVRFRNPNGSL